MKRKIGVSAFAFLLAAAPLMFSQDLQKKPSPAAPDELLGPRLIAWSQMQKPQPVTEPSSNEKAQEPPQQEPAAQTLTGTIVKDGGRYVLKVSKSSTVYELDDQEQAQRYEGKQVKVAGTLRAKGDSFHVISIELIS